MSGERATATTSEGLELLERAINYTLSSVQLVTHDALSLPSPCSEWDMRALLAHLHDSLTALHEAADIGRVGLAARGHPEGPPVEPVSDDPVAALRGRAGTTLGAWTNAVDLDVVDIAGVPLSTGIVTGAGALEVAVHGWDIAQTCGRPQQIPATLAEELLQLAPLLVTEADRPTSFAPPLDVPPCASSASRLLAFLGRRCF
ncbi:MAG: TIGR03086 family protein [Nocardioidaceae bacterium]|nr:TIGR03086 family protein [Nocardioidaceae bacterium]